MLDEPTVGLDIGSRRAILDHVHRLCKEDGLGVLWATHLIDEAKDADGVVILHQGEVKAAGTPDAVCSKADTETLEDAFQSFTETAPT